MRSLGRETAERSNVDTARVVKRIDILPGGKSVALYTGFFNRESVKHGREISIRDLSLRRSLFTGQGHNEAVSTTGTFTQLLRREQLIGYLIDRRGHFLVTPRVMDELFRREVIP